MSNQNNQRPITLGSLFDGSGGFPLAGAINGAVPLWAAEIEPYPISVTRERFPQMQHLGSVTAIKGGEIPPVDIITFGSPCQDMSIAGKRAGMQHAAKGDEDTTRSGLFYEAIRIIREMREATNGKHPTFAVWENVPGAFSSNRGEDFRCVLQELTQISGKEVSIPQPKKGKWHPAGEIVGDGFSIAWRILDAQYWGVPQRRKRIYLVADFADKRAGHILFERESLSGNPEPGETEREEAPCNAPGSVGGSDLAGSISKPAYAVVLNDQGGNQILIEKDDLSPTLRAQSHQHEPVIAMERNIGAFISRNGAKANGIGFSADTSPTLRANMSTEVVHPNFEEEPLSAITVKVYGVDCRNAVLDEEKTHTLQAKAICVGNGQLHQADMGDKTGALNCMHDQQAVIHAALPPRKYIVRRLTPLECCRLQGFPDGWGDTAKKEGFSEEEYQFWLTVRQTKEKANGKEPKHYTQAQMLAWYNKLHTDSAEYKMWGNGIALPCAAFVLGGVVEAIREERVKRENA